jgi:hypothetical protein
VVVNGNLKLQIFLRKPGTHEFFPAFGVPGFLIEPAWFRAAVQAIIDQFKIWKLME